MSIIDECMETLATQLLEVMHKKNWSIAVAADFMCVRKDKLAEIVNHKTKNVSLKVLSQIADSLDRSVSSLICPEVAEKETQLREKALLLRQMQDNLDKLKKVV